MLIPIADVPRWYAERKPADTVAVAHGEDRLTWSELERRANARARVFMEQGVKPGDFLVELGGHAIQSVGDFQKWMYVMGIGTKVELGLVRDGQPMRVTVTIEARPPEATNS